MLAQLTRDERPNALIATSFHVLQRTAGARLPDQLLPWFVLFGHHLFCLLAVTGYGGQRAADAHAGARRAGCDEPA